MRRNNTVTRITGWRPPLRLVRDAERLAMDASTPWRHVFRHHQQLPGICDLCLQPLHRHRAPLWRRIVAWLVGVEP